MNKNAGLSYKMIFVNIILYVLLLFVCLFLTNYEAGKSARAADFFFVLFFILVFLIPLIQYRFSRYHKAQNNLSTAKSLLYAVVWEIAIILVFIIFLISITP